MGGRGASVGGNGISMSNKIKREWLSAGLNSKFKGINRDAQNGTGTFTYKDAKAVSSSDAAKMDVLRIQEKNGNTLIEGLKGNQLVFYANKTSDKTIQNIIEREKKKKAKLESKVSTEIRTTSTYDRWKKRHDANFAAWFGKR